ncbi:hypothetical protein P167DRAFT_58936 [Morchella conica CCBAS932]|uniref:Uncharacterized protein n=1 Tax=Morchella conica CCBAS932 TaxID=1392247 RepID=A0A3N4KZG5_9PEZI|nr:hypothetical protein P167DRAFT_58936 [Morchella conica CCBAS932]
MFKRRIAYICVLVLVSVILLSATATALYQYTLNQNLNKYTQNPDLVTEASNHEHSLFKRKGGRGKTGGRRSSGSGRSGGCNSASVGTVFRVKICRHVVDVPTHVAGPSWSSYVRCPRQQFVTNICQEKGGVNQVNSLISLQGRLYCEASGFSIPECTNFGLCQPDDYTNSGAGGLVREQYHTDLFC